MNKNLLAIMLFLGTVTYVSAAPADNRNLYAQSMDTMIGGTKLGKDACNRCEMKKTVQDKASQQERDVHIAREERPLLLLSILMAEGKERHTITHHG